jgi:hypothetical protein
MPVPLPSDFSGRFPIPMAGIAVISHSGLSNEKTTSLVSVKIFRYPTEGIFSVACRGIFQDRGETFLFYSEGLIEIGKCVLTIQLHTISLSELGQHSDLNLKKFGRLLLHI